MIDFQPVETLRLNAPRIPELDGIRGIAIILVIGCHYEVFARQIWGLPKFGWVGVDIFFVLSGFLITSVLLNLRGRDDSFRFFYDRRLRRILPPYIMFMVLIYAVSVALVTTRFTAPGRRYRTPSSYNHSTDYSAPLINWHRTQCGGLLTPHYRMLCAA